MSSVPERRRPRLVFAAGSLAQGAGGIAELSRQVLHALRDLCREQELDVQVHVLEQAGPAGGDELFAAAAAGLQAVHWHAGSRRAFTLGLVLSRPDVLLFDHVGLARFHGLAGGLLRQPYILLIHSIEIWNTRRADYRRTAHRAELLIANSAFTANKARRHYPGLPEIAVCWPGKDRPTVDGNGNNPGLAVPGLGPHAMLIVGRLDAAQRHKGHDQLLEALPLVLRDVPDAQLVIAGDGDDRARLEAKAQALGVAAAVVFTGRLGEGELHRLYAHCALFVMPSDGDGFGLVFLEAMMHGLPCVGLERGAAAEILDGGACGVLVDRDDLPGMAQRLANLLADGARRASMGEAGRQRYRAVFRREHYSDRLRSVLSGRLGGPLGGVRRLRPLPR